MYVHASYLFGRENTHSTAIFPHGNTHLRQQGLPTGKDRLEKYTRQGPDGNIWKGEYQIFPWIPALLFLPDAPSVDN